METSGSPVTREAIAQHWGEAAALTQDPRSGIFGPNSISWRINRESALFLGAGRAALLQLAHPWVAAALDQHSNLKSDPLARFHNTFRVVFTMIFGTLEQALAASRYLYHLHTRIQGELPESVGAYRSGSRYDANEVGALRWVFATLVESALLAYESVLPPLTLSEKNAYFNESKVLASLFGIPPDALPVDWQAFESYNLSMWNSNLLGVTPLSREMAHRVLNGRGTWVPIPFWYRALTASWMPEPLRIAFALPDTARDRRAATRALQWLPTMYLRLPAFLRFVGPYREASCRLELRHAGPFTQWSNRFWMGEALMPFRKPSMQSTETIATPPARD